MDLAAVQTTIVFLEGQIAKSDGVTKDGYTKALAQAQESLTKMLLTVAEPKPVDSTNVTYKRNTNIKTIESALSESMFKGTDINETTRFIERLEKVYVITVTEVDPSLEKDFIKLVKLRLSDSVFKNLIASKCDVSTFEKLKAWIKSTYGGNFNAFQILQRAWDVDFKPEEKFSVYAQKVSEELRTGLIAINKQYQDINGSDKTLSNDALMEFIAGLLVSNHLRGDCWPIFKDMVNDMDKMLTSTEVANKAEYYRERLGSDFIGKQSDSYWAKRNTEKTQKDRRRPQNNNRDNRQNEKPDSKVSNGKSSEPERKKSTKWKSQQ